jgi:hypothetical protein
LKFEKQEHNIDKQIINVSIDGDIDESKAKDLQSAIVYLYKQKIGEALDKIFSELVPPDVYVSLDKLVIDLPKINISDLDDMKELSRKIESAFSAKARNIIREKVLKANKEKLEKDGFGNIRVSKWAILESFLEDGHYPSWASSQNQSIDKIFDELMRKNPDRVAEIVLRLSKKNRKLLDRLIYQLPPKHIERLIAVVYQRAGRAVVKQLQTIRRRLGKRYRSMRGQKSVDKAILSAALEYAIDQVRKGKKISYKEREFVQKIIDAIQSKYTHVADEDIVYRSDGVKPEHSKQYSDLDVLEYFLQYGSIPYWASADSRSSIHALFDRLSNKKLVGLQRMILKHVQDENFMRRLVLQFNDQQIFQLLEPIPGDQMRFLEGMLREFQAFSGKLVGLSSSQAQQAVKEAALEYMLNRSGRFVKEDLTKLALEKAAALARAPFEEGIELLFGHLQQASAQSYDLTRSELLRALNEIDPALSDKLERQIQERRVLQTEEEEIQKSLEEMRAQIEAGQLPIPEIERLKKDRKALRKRLSKLKQRLEQLGASAPESVTSLSEQKLKLERQISQLGRQLKETEERQEAELQALNQERERLRQELQNVKTSLSRLQKKLFKDYEKAKTAQQRQKLSNEFDHLLSSLLRDQNRLNIRLTEVQANLAQSEISKNIERRLKRQEKRIQDQLQKLATDIAEVEGVVREIKAEVEKEAAEESLDTPSTTSKLDFIIFFLQYGSIPWWAEEYRKSSIEEIIQEFAEKHGEKLKHAFARLGRNPVVWQRLVNQLTESTLEQVLVVIFPNFAGFAISAAIMLEKIKESQIIPALNKVDLRYFKWSKVAELLFSSGTSKSASDFLKELVIEVGKEFNIAPSQLLEYMKNLSDNNPGTRLSIFADIIAPIAKDEELLEAEKDLLEAVFKKQQIEEGLILAEEKRFETLEEYLRKGIFTDAAVKAKYNSHKAMERLFLELLAEQPDAIKSLLEDNLSNPQMRRRLIMDMSSPSFWEVVLLLAPQSMPVIQAYIQDLGKALGDSKMFMAKEVLLRYVMQLDSKPFMLRDYLEEFLKTAAKATERQKIAILNEWKRKIYSLGQVDSSLILSLMQAEIQDLKAQKEASADESEKNSLQDSMDALIAEYQQQSQRMVYVLNREQIEREGLVNLPENTPALYERIAQIEAEIEKLRGEMVEGAVGEQLIRQIMSWRQIAQLEGQLNLLKQEEPFSVRYLRIQQNEKSVELGRLQEEEANLKIPAAKAILDLPEPTELEQTVQDSLAFSDFVKSQADDQKELLQNLGEVLRQLLEKQQELIDAIKNANSPEEINRLRRQLLTLELQQNDALDRLAEGDWNANIRAELQRSRANIRGIFQHLRSLADQGLHLLAQARKEALNQGIQELTEELEELAKEEEQLIEDLKAGKEEEQLPEIKEEVKAPKPPDKPVDEPLYVRNAGMVLLHAYYTRLFMALKMIEKGKFVSEEAQIRAVHMLQYIVTGQTSHPENELVLNKILCGLPLSTPVPMDVGLTEEELKTCDSLLQGAINNWPRLKTMTPNALRGTFLVRDGSIEEEADRWKLKVEKGSFDMLLRTIPWGFTFIRYGWLDKFVMVEWEIPGG